MHFEKKNYYLCRQPITAFCIYRVCYIFQTICICRPLQSKRPCDGNCEQENVIMGNAFNLEAHK